MAETGLLTEVRWEWDGTELTADAAIGATTIFVLDPYTVSEGSTVWLSEDPLVNPYVVESVNNTSGEVVLETATLGTFLEGEPIIPDVGGEPGQIWVAECIMPDTDTPIEVPLTIHDLAVMPEGVYDPPVAITISDDYQQVLNLPGSLPRIPGEFIPPSSLPVPDLSDGEGPSNSPGVEVTPGIGAFFLRWAPPLNNDPMRFEVHVSENEGFVPTADTYYSETAGYTMTVRNLPQVDLESGVPLPFLYTTEPDPANPTAGDHPYYFRVIAKDADDAAPAGPEAVGRLTQITGPDIAAKTVRGENIVGSTLTGDLFSGEVVLGSTISTGALDENGDIVGARVELGPEGLKVVDAAGNEIFYVSLTNLESAKLRAHFEMLSATVENDFTMYGDRNQIAVGSSLALSSGVEPPTAVPTPSFAYDTVTLDKTSAVPTGSTLFGDLGTFKLDPSQITSMTWNTVWNAWCVCQQKSGGFRVWRFTATGALYLLPGGPSGAGPYWVDDVSGRSNATIAYGTDAGGSGVASLSQDNSGQWYIIGPSRINRIPDSWIVDAPARPPVLGYNAIDDVWLLAQSNGGNDGVFHVRSFTLAAYSGSGAFPNAISTGVFTGEAGSGLGKRSNGIYYGPGDTFGSNRYVWSVDDYITNYVFTTDGVERNNDGAYENWTGPGAKLGLAFNEAQFGTVDSNGIITKYTNWTWTSSVSQAWVGLSAYDSDTATETPGVTDTGVYGPHAGQTAGQHETPVGTIASVSMKRRAKMLVTVPATQDSGGLDDPDKWRVYWARQTAAPTDGTPFKLAGEAGVPTGQSSLTVTGDPLGAAPPGGLSGTVGATNNFPEAVPASLFSAGLDTGGEPIIDLQGDGSGRLGDRKWDKNGDPVDGDPAYDTGWVTFAPGAGEIPFASATTAVAMYRRVGKWVQVRLQKASTAARDTSASTNGDFADVNITGTGLPANLRPSYTVEGSARFGGVPQACWLQSSGLFVWAGGMPRNYASGSVLVGLFSYFLD